MDTKSPISRLTNAGIGFNGSPLPKARTSEEVEKIQSETLALKRFDAFLTWSGSAVVIMITAAATYVAGAGIYSIPPGLGAGLASGLYLKCA